jgi:hypothetical protein
MPRRFEQFTPSELHQLSVSLRNFTYTEPGRKLWNEVADEIDTRREEDERTREHEGH